MMTVSVRAKIFPTEDPKKVGEAVLNIFPSKDSGVEGEDFYARPSDLERFELLVRQMRILDAVRGRMRAGISGNTTTFQLNKQAAYAGKVSMAEGVPPLGNITVTIEAEDIEKAIDSIAPMTVDGEVVS